MLNFSILKFAIPAFGLAAISSYAYGYHNGKLSVRDSLIKNRIVTMEQVKEIDDEIFSADSNTLCDLLGGCSVSNK